MSKRKPKPGQCTVCGRAVVQPSGMSASELEWGFVNGHYYSGGRLEKVRCPMHMDRDDNRTPMATCGGQPMVN